MCPNCNEEAELSLNKKDVKQLLKKLKGSARKQSITLSFTCARCRKEASLEVSKRELKILYEGFKKPTITEAEKHFFHHIKY